ncbi:MAG: lactate racemase [Pseudonocardiales bacterium]|nr:lactate racemase [Pseudonocardiales bacterium]
MRVDLPYGSGLLPVELPEAATDVVLPRATPPARTEADVLAEALRRPIGVPPLSERVRRGDRVAISVCDHTRPQPREPMLRARLEHLHAVRDEDITVLVATGTHRASTPHELRAMFGAELVERLRIENHDCVESEHVDLGQLAGLHGGDVDVAVDRRWVEADVRLTTGFVEPHFFAGFSGGPKMVTPGLAALHTVQQLHNVARIGSPDAIWGVVEGNPVHDAIRAAAALAPPTMIFDVLLDREHRITHAFAGEMLETHRVACAAAREIAMQPVAQRYPVVVTTNGGYPLDQNLYQAVKGMRSAAQVAADGALIICAAECADGMPDDSPFAAQLLSGRTPQQVLADLAAGADVPEQWQLQVLAQLQARFRIGLHCAGIPDDTLAAAGIEPVGDIAGAVARALAEAGPAARVCVLPSGAETIPYVDS